MNCDECETAKTCENCNDWERNKSIDICEGICKKFKINGGALVPPEQGGSLFNTRHCFGCICFSEKSKGPFEVRENKYGYYICYKPKARNLGNWVSWAGANTTCNMLNDEWLRRE